jgi:hypothetical protein
MVALQRKDSSFVGCERNVNAILLSGGVFMAK